VRSDIYSLGATLYHMLTHQPPLDAKQRFLNPTALQSAHSINPKISSQTDRAIMSAIALHPDQRPATIDDFRDTLLSSSSVIPTPINPRVVTNHNHTWAQALQANRLLIAALIGLIVFAILVTLIAAPPATAIHSAPTPTALLR
jgi:serine/threonine protein kinase